MHRIDRDEVWPSAACRVRDKKYLGSQRLRQARYRLGRSAGDRYRLWRLVVW